MAEREIVSELEGSLERHKSSSLDLRGKNPLRDGVECLDNLFHGFAHSGSLLSARLVDSLD